MEEIRPLIGYSLLLEGAEITKVDALHTFTGETRGNFFGDYVIQDVLLNHGCELEEDKRPKSFLDISGGIWNRQIIGLGLTYLNQAIDLVSQPAVVATSRDSIIGPAQEDRRRLVVAGGHDAEKLEGLQRSWIQNPDLGEKVRTYKKSLELAFAEYNMGFVLALIREARGAGIPADWKNEKRFQDRINAVLDSRAYSCLDSAYYNLGNSFSNLAGRNWEELSKDNLGKFFILQPGEIREYMRRR